MKEKSYINLDDYKIIQPISYSRIIQFALFRLSILFFIMVLASYFLIYSANWDSLVVVFPAVIIFLGIAIIFLTTRIKAIRAGQIGFLFKDMHIRERVVYIEGYHKIKSLDSIVTLPKHVQSFKTSITNYNLANGAQVKLNEVVEWVIIDPFVYLGRGYEKNKGNDLHDNGHDKHKMVIEKELEDYIKFSNQELLSDRYENTLDLLEKPKLHSANILDQLTIALDAEARLIEDKTAIVVFPLIGIAIIKIIPMPVHLTEYSRKELMKVQNEFTRKKAEQVSLDHYIKIIGEVAQSFGIDIFTAVTIVKQRFGEDAGFQISNITIDKVNTILREYLKPKYKS